MCVCECFINTPDLVASRFALSDAAADCRTTHNDIGVSDRLLIIITASGETKLSDEIC